MSAPCTPPFTGSAATATERTEEEAMMEPATCVPLTFDRLVHPGIITLARVIELLSVNPAKILNVPGGTLSEGAPADITLLAPDLVATVDPAKSRSRSRNTPFGENDAPARPPTPTSTSGP